MEAERCPNCAESKILPGRVTYQTESANIRFVPGGAHSVPWNPGIPVFGGFHCCVSCGYVWTTLNPEELRRFMGANGTRLGKQYFETLIHGPYHDLPDYPEACEAADKVAEIDALLVSGKELEATRRYRELTGKTWDEVLRIMPLWRNYQRAMKLKHFGWHPKEKAKPEVPAREVHPMQDRWLDG